MDFVFFIKVVILVYLHLYFLKCKPFTQAFLLSYFMHFYGIVYVMVLICGVLCRFVL